MRLRYARLTTPGPVRTVNEDWLDFWEPGDPLVDRTLPPDCRPALRPVREMTADAPASRRLPPP